jgi:hypothetical protein
LIDFSNVGKHWELSFVLPGGEFLVVELVGEPSAAPCPSLCRKSQRQEPPLAAKQAPLMIQVIPSNEKALISKASFIVLGAVTRLYSDIK